MLAVSWDDALAVGDRKLGRVTGDDERLLLEGFRAAMRVPPTSSARLFLGSNPVSVERRHFDHLASNIYWVAEKTDGMRFLMFCTRHRGLKLCLLVDRRHAMFVAGMPMHDACFQGTVLDGELVLNKASQVVQFCVFDAAALCGAHVGCMPYSKRLTYLRMCLEGQEALRCTEPFQLRLKNCFSAHDAWKLFIEQYTCVVPRLYDTDGLIFTPESAPYVHGRHMTQFKWKPCASNTVDFQVGPRNKLLVLERGGLREACDLHPDDAASAQVGSIVECKMTGGASDVAGKSWRVCHVRTDKTAPNDLLTYQRTLVNIEEDIRLQEFDALFQH